MTDNQKYAILSTTYVIAFLFTVISLFLHPGFAIIPFLIFLVTVRYTVHKYPDKIEEAKIAAENNSKVTRFDVKYVHGIDFAEFEQKLILTITKTGIFFSGKNINSSVINFSEIKNVEISQDIGYTEKKKSVEGRMIFCGLVGGLPGAILGGISGVCPTLKEKTVYYLEIFTENGSVIVSTNKNSCRKILSLIRTSGMINGG